MVQHGPVPPRFRYLNRRQIRLERRLANSLLRPSMVSNRYHRMSRPHKPLNPTDDQIRCIFRVAEFSQGYDGPLRTVEFWFYVLDTLPLVLGIAVWTVVWPPKILGEQRDFIGEVETGMTTGQEMGSRNVPSKDSSQSGLMGYDSSKPYQSQGYPPQEVFQRDHRGYQGA